MQGPAPQLFGSPRSLAAGLACPPARPAARRDAVASTGPPFAFKGALASLLAHGCLLLAVMLLNPGAAPPQPAGETAVEWIEAPGAPTPAPRDLAEASGEPSPGRAILEAKTGPIAPGNRPRKANNATRPAPQKRLMLPFDSGSERFRAVAVPLPSASGGEATNYSFLVGGMLERVKHYPAQALRRGAKGVATIGFVLDGSGCVAAVSLLRSSGEADLDAEGVSLVRRAAPFPPPPPGAQRAFAIEVAFGMRQ